MKSGEPKRVDLFYSHFDGEFLGFAGCDEVKAELGFGGIGQAHPGFNAIIRLGLIERPSDKRGLGRRNRRISVVNADCAGAADFAEEDCIFTEIGMQRIDERRVGQGFLKFKRGTRGELAGGEIMLVPPPRGNPDTVIGPGRALGPR